MQRWVILSLILLGIFLAALTTFFLAPLFKDTCEAPITCSDDAQCGGTVIGERFCRGDEVWGNGQVNTCSNKGTCESVCETTYQTILVETCENGCRNGTCL